MHPENQARALGGLIGIEAKLPDFLRRFQDGLENHLQGNPLRQIERAGDLGGIFRHLLQRFFSVEMLTAGDEPDFDGCEVFHEKEMERLGRVEEKRGRRVLRETQADFWP